MNACFGSSRPNQARSRAASSLGRWRSLSPNRKQKHRSVRRSGLRYSEARSMKRLRSAWSVIESSGAGMKMVPSEKAGRGGYFTSRLFRRRGWRRRSVPWRGRSCPLPSPVGGRVLAAGVFPSPSSSSSRAAFLVGVPLLSVSLSRFGAECVVIFNRSSCREEEDEEVVEGSYQGRRLCIRGSRRGQCYRTVRLRERGSAITVELSLCVDRSCPKDGS